MVPPKAPKSAKPAFDSDSGAPLYAFITVRGGAGALKAELGEAGVKAEERGSDWCAGQVSAEQLASLRLHIQTANRVLLLLGEAKDRATLVKLAQGISKPSGSFSVRTNSPDSQEIQEEIGGLIHDTTDAPVNLSKPDSLYYIHEADGSFVFGIDAFGDLGKRHYKIITGAHSIAGPLAAVTLRLAGWNPKDKKDLLVWPCTTGELAIEAALWMANKSPRAYELHDFSESEPECAVIAADPKLSMVSSTQKNAKVAGVHKIIKFSRQDADWLDTKHEENSVEHVVGLLPNLKLYPKLTPEIFYQLEYILTKAGVAAFLCVNEESAAILEAEAVRTKEYAVGRVYIWGGKHAYTLVVLTRQTQRKKRSTVSSKKETSESKTEV